MGAIIIIAIVIFIIYKISDSNDKKREEESRRQIAAQRRREEIATQQRLAKQKERDRQQRMRSFEVNIQTKVDKNSIIQVLQNNGIKSFYHFTSINNIQSIRQYGGLFSWWELERRGVEIPNPGGTNLSRQLDRSHGIQDYVRLSFCDDHPMAYRIKQNGTRLVLLQIDISVAEWRDTLFSNMNATDKDETHGGTLADLQKVDFIAVKKHYVRKDDPAFKPHQAEILVKNNIPIQYIKNIDSPLTL